MNRAVLAVAGSRKTQSIVELCSKATDDGKRRLVLTYTISAQRDVEARLTKACTDVQLPDVSGWYTFLLHHWVRPYIPLLYSERRLTGLNFDENVGLPPGRVDQRTGAARHLDSESRAYKRYLSKLAVDVSKASRSAVIDRLEHIYSEIHIDEVQDLTGYDLDIVEALFASKIDVRLVGDVRQSTFNTNPRDQRNKQYRLLEMLNWFTKHEKAERLVVEHSNQTWRSNQQIATFSDTIFPVSCDFPATESLQTDTSNHDGVFIVPSQHVGAYIEAYQPLCLRHAKTTTTPDYVEATNFGVAKGITCNRVLIFPTGPIRDFINKSKFLTGKSACGLYVAVTRAVHSVGFVMDNCKNEEITVWRPRT